MSRYTQIYKEMRESNKEIFDTFKKIHDKYQENDQKYQEEFNKVGEKVVSLIRDYESKLTAKSESGQFAKFSSNLADKFWDRIRKDFPEIDFVGTKIE